MVAQIMASTNLGRTVTEIDGLLNMPIKLAVFDLAY